VDNLSHDWTSSVDTDHLAEIRRDPARYAPGGVGHLVLEVMAYAADECTSCTVTLHEDGSVSVADNGRGTDIRYDERGKPVRKPVMATKDLRFFDQPAPPSLPDGFHRRGASVVAALSEWLVHANHRQDGAWSQRYEYGVPVTDLLPVAAGDATGTSVRFRPGPAVTPSEVGTVPDLVELARAGWPHLAVEVRDDRGRSQVRS
jgi:DNA gyrase subunit B